jgi:hypothetical protein
MRDSFRQRRRLSFFIYVAFDHARDLNGKGTLSTLSTFSTGKWEDVPRARRHRGRSEDEDDDEGSEGEERINAVVVWRVTPPLIWGEKSA